MSIPYAIAVAVGPDPQELIRVADLIESVRAYEDRPCDFVMVDDGASDRKLQTHFKFPANWKVISVPHPRRQFPDRAAKANRGKGICAAILQGLATVAKHAPQARFTLKMDTDALVIGPFVQKLASVIEKNPNVGMIGAYDRTPSGTPRDISKNAANVKRLYESGSVVAPHIGEALKNGYRFGEHCLGGAYAVSGEMLARMLKQKYLDDPSLWLPIDSPEDVMVGIYTKAVACDYISYVDKNEVFGVRHRGLDDSPQKLVERGYSVIHAVKNDPKFGEEEIRRFFRERRHVE